MDPNQNGNQYNQDLLAQAGIDTGQPLIPQKPGNKKKFVVMGVAVFFAVLSAAVLFLALSGGRDKQPSVDGRLSHDIVSDGIETVKAFMSAAEKEDYREATSYLSATSPLRRSALNKANLEYYVGQVDWPTCTISEQADYEAENNQLPTGAFEKVVYLQAICSNPSGVKKQLKFDIRHNQTADGNGNWSIEYVISGVLDDA